MGAMTVQVVGRHIALPRGLGRFSIVQPQLGVSAGGSVTLASLRIKMRLGRGNRCHDHGMVGIRSASGKPHPVHWCRQPTHRPTARSFLRSP
jgi:hypothetical protein